MEKKHARIGTNRSHVYDMTYIVNVWLSLALAVSHSLPLKLLRLHAHANAYLLHEANEFHFFFFFAFSLYSLVIGTHATLSSYFASFSLPPFAVRVRGLHARATHTRIDSEPK